MHALHLWIPVLASFLAPADDENRLLHELTHQGLPVEGETSGIRLPEPTMADGLSAAEQHALIKQVAGPRRRLEHLLRDSIVAPFVLKISQPEDTDARYRHVDVWYVARGDLTQFQQEEFLGNLVDFGGQSSEAELASRLVPPAQLLERGIQPEEGSNEVQQFLFNSVELFDRVSLRSTRRIVLSSNDKSVLIAATIDPRFTSDEVYPNDWRKVKVNADGTKSIGEPQPYVASGSYTKVTRLHEPEGSLFIEHHHLFLEPVEWFEGRNLLRSKLPLAVQRGVRQLRQKLKKSG